MASKKRRKASSKRREAPKKGRPSDLTNDVAKAIFAELRQGTPIDLTADAVGVSRSTLREWVRRGEGNDERPADEPYASFAKGYRQSRAQGERALRQVVIQAATRVRPQLDEHGRQRTFVDDEGVKRTAFEGFNPNAEQLRAAMWLLSRGWPEHWGQQRESISVSVDIPDVPDADGDEQAGGGVSINVILARDDDTTP